MAKHQWKQPVVSVEDAMMALAAENEVIVGDPTLFRGADIDYGWDLDDIGGMIESIEVDNGLAGDEHDYVTVDGGVVVEKPIDMARYNKLARSMSFQHDFIKKNKGLVYSLMKDHRGFVHVFAKYYDPDEMRANATNLERADKIVHVGAFKDFGYAKDYATTH